MNKIALGTLALGLSIAAPTAFAQTQPCPAGSWLCADITIGGGPAQPPPVIVSPPPPVYVAPPPRVIVLPPRPRVYFVPPPPRVYMPPPVVVYQPQQQFYQPQPQYYLPPPRPRGYVGLQASLGGVYMSSPSVNGGAFMGGINGGLRFRGPGHLGAELAVGVYSGTDYNGDGRTEVPVSFTGLFYFNPQNRFQVYGLLGLGASFADVTYAANNQAQHNYLTGANYAYVGGTAGLGVELQLSPRVAMFADVRGFVRGRVDGDTSTNPEFTRVDPSTGATQTTNTSVGALGQLGLILYF